MTRYLRNKKDGFIYEWHPILAANPLCEEVTEMQAYPERFIPPAVMEVASQAKRRGRKPLDVSTDEVDDVAPTPPELAADAARGWPK